uniref:Uncharacterized protein n=1 Tax=Quercus lobata TaxID=97700 RepID=A0A7N2R573_QUELO
MMMGVLDSITPKVGRDESLLRILAEGKVRRILSLRQPCPDRAISSFIRTRCFEEGPSCSWKIRRPKPRRAVAQALQYRVQNSFGRQPRTVQSSADPESHQKKKGKTGIGPNSKENQGISGTAALIVIQCAAPDRAVLSSFINHPQQFRDWTDGTNPRTVQSSADPESHQKKKGKTGIGPNSKENQGISGTAALIVIQCAAPDRAVLSSFINHPQQFRDWTDGTNQRTVQSSADPESHQKKKGKTGIGPNLKENQGISGTTALIAIQCAAPDRAVLSSFINHPQQFRDWTDGTNPRTVQSSADPESHQKKKGKTGIGPNLKENQGISGTAALIAIQCAALDRAVLSSFINHPQQFRDWTDGTNDLMAVGVENGTAELQPRKYSVVRKEQSYCGEIEVGVTFTPKVEEQYHGEELGGWKQSYCYY